MRAEVLTGEALGQVRLLLDSIDHAARVSIDHGARLHLVTEGRRAARQLDALVTILVAEADKAGSSMMARGTPTTSWLTLDGGTSAKEAAGLVFAGRDLTDRPAVQRAALAGEIGVKQARGVARVLAELPAALDAEQRARAEALLLTRATTTPAEGLAYLADQILAEVAPAALPNGEERAQALEARSKRARSRRALTFRNDSDGSVLISGSLPELDASPFVKLITAYVEHQRRTQREAGDKLDPAETLRSVAQRRADALVTLVADHTHMCQAPGHEERQRSGRHSLRAVTAGQPVDRPARGGIDQGRLLTGAGGEAALRYSEATVDPEPREPGNDAERDAAATLVVPNPRVAGDRPRVVVLLQEADLRLRAEQAGLLDSGAQIAPGDLRRLCCDADVTPVVLGASSEILDVGRTRRLVTDAIRRALSLRDGGCLFPGCVEPDARCEAHHTRPWWAGGRTALNELVLLCPHHHALVEPPRFFTSPPPDRWQIRIGAHGRPEVIPPARVDPTRTPITCRSGPLTSRPTRAPDGKSVTVIREDPDDGAPERAP